MEDYPSNSHKSKEKAANPPSEKRVDKIIIGSAKTAKKSGLQKIIGMFISDEITDVKSYVVYNIIIPTIKRMISDSVDVALNGETGRRKNNSSVVSNYRGGYSRDDRESRGRYNVRDLYEVDDIILDNYGDCESVLDEMNALIEKYGLVSVSDLYDMLGETGRSHTDCKYGWTSLRTARIIPARGGFMLKLPRVIPLN